MIEKKRKIDELMESKQPIVETELEKMCQITKSEWATAVLMDVKTGEIKAISNLQRDSTKRGEVFYREGLNHALMGYDPGSVMKPISMMIALEDKIVGLNASIPTGSSFSYAGGRPITDSHAYSSLTPKQIIAYSSNIGMSKIIIKGYGDDPRRYRKRLEDIGMFEPLNLGIYGERLPYIPKLGTKNKDRIDMTRVCYGYATRIPPIYTLSFYNAIANGGKFVRPRIVKELISDGQTDTVFDVSHVRERICSEKWQHRFATSSKPLFGTPTAQVVRCRTTLYRFPARPAQPINSTMAATTRRRSATHSAASSPPTLRNIRALSSCKAVRSARHAAVAPC